MTLPLDGNYPTYYKDYDSIYMPTKAARESGELKRVPTPGPHGREQQQRKQKHGKLGWLFHR